MIKLGRFFYVHYTTLFLIAVSYFNRRLEILAISYAVIFLHECAHLLAAVIIGLRPSHIVFYPFGVNLKLKNKLVYSLSDEIILYLAGPLLNILLALASIGLKSKSGWWELFYYNNLCLFLFNLLPILPMDGAVILKKMLSYIMGSRRAERVLRTVSAALVLLLAAGEIYLLVKGNFNFTMLFSAVFLTANIFTNREKYHTDFVRELVFYKSKDSFEFKRATTYILKEGGNFRKLAEAFVPGRHYAILCEDKNGNVTEIMTEKQIIEKILKNTE